MISAYAIKKNRLKLKMSQDKLAKACGYTSRSMICKLEKGEIIDLPISKVEKLAEVLQVSILDLLKKG